VTLIGPTHVSRVGLSLLGAVGLEEFAARSDEQYLRTGSDLAANRSRLDELRLSLRQRMRSSPLMDARRFARDVEAAYRRMWIDWCGRT
jgi:protein O-GlcNAc transferase